MFEDELVLVMSPKHRLAGASQIRPRDLETETVLIYPPREESTLINKLLRPAGVEAHRVIEVPLTEAIVELGGSRDRHRIPCPLGGRAGGGSRQGGDPSPGRPRLQASMARGDHAQSANPAISLGVSDLAVELLPQERAANVGIDAAPKAIPS